MYYIYNIHTHIHVPPPLNSSFPLTLIVYNTMVWLWSWLWDTNQIQDHRKPTEMVTSDDPKVDLDQNLVHQRSHRVDLSRLYQANIPEVSKVPPAAPQAQSGSGERISWTTTAEERDVHGCEAQDSTMCVPSCVQNPTPIPLPLQQDLISMMLILPSINLVAHMVVAILMARLVMRVGRYSLRRVSKLLCFLVMVLLAGCTLVVVTAGVRAVSAYLGSIRWGNPVHQSWMIWDATWSCIVHSILTCSIIRIPLNILADWLCSGLLG
jgi:hypothetical protein